jgi:hypothetical protein
MLFLFSLTLPFALHPYGAPKAREFTRRRYDFHRFSSTLKDFSNFHEFLALKIDGF